MIETLVVIGAVAGIIAAAVGLLVIYVVGQTLWEAWWLYPLWSIVMEPLGVPSITFWQFIALDVFVSVIVQQVPSAGYAREEDQKRRDRDAYGRIVTVLLKPVIAYLLIRWAVS